MEDFAYVPSPKFRWRITNFTACDEQLSPTFYFFECSWRLKFIRFLDVDVEKVQIVLESLSRSKNAQRIFMKCAVHLRYKKCLQCNPVILENKRCCVWSNSSKHMIDSNGDFFVKFTPLIGMSQQFLTDESKRLEIANRNKIPRMRSLIEDFGSLFNNSEHSDYTLKCGQLSLPVHKAVLAARCEYFAALFRSPMTESDENSVGFQDMDPDSLQHLIRYLYTGNLPKLPLDSIRKLYTLADMFLHEPLKTECVSLMVDDFTREKETSFENEEAEDLEEGKELLKQLFLTREWKKLSEVCPNLVREMCKPILFGTVET